MQAKLLSAKSSEELEKVLNAWLKETVEQKSIGDSEEKRRLTIINVTPYTMQIIIPTVLNPDRGTQETIFQLLIIYS